VLVVMEGEAVAVDEDGRMTMRLCVVKVNPVVDAVPVAVVVETETLTTVETVVTEWTDTTVSGVIVDVRVVKHEGKT
jgi:hypothetical protein